ncbi:MAG: lactate racemase domain-containing protein, partial [Negativicutes bacterium]|nr:lactate racemase domain-containing protein [Negativicutes bacterium]
MAEVAVKLPYGQETVALRVPGENLIGIYSPTDMKPVVSVRDEVIRALGEPIGTKPLKELASGASKVVIVADDNTRLTPTDQIIPVLLDEINLAGIEDKQITIIIALGTHRPMTDEEILA